MPSSSKTDKGLELTANDCKAIADLLKQNCLLLELPPPTLNAVLKIYGKKAGTEVAEQIKRRLGSVSPKKFDEKLAILRRLDGGELLAINVLVAKCESVLKKMTPRGGSHEGLAKRGEWNPEAAQWDERVHQSLQQFTKTPISSTVLSATSPIVAQMRDMRQEWPIAKVQPRDIDHRESFYAKTAHFYFNNQIIWKRSIAYLHGVHTKHTGLMLVNRIAGHKLPVEMVDLIVECLTDSTAAQYDTTDTMLCVRLEDGSILQASTVRHMRRVLLDRKMAKREARMAEGQDNHAP